MKKALMILAFVAMAFAFFAASAAKAETYKTSTGFTVDVTYEVDETAPRAAVLVKITDQLGRPVAGRFFTLSTSRNESESGWEANVDRIEALDGGITGEEGFTMFQLETSEPAGTTVTVSLCGEVVTEFSLSYAQI